MYMNTMSEGIANTPAIIAHGFADSISSPANAPSIDDYNEGRPEISNCEFTILFGAFQLAGGALSVRALAGEVTGSEWFVNFLNDTRGAVRFPIPGFSSRVTADTFAWNFTHADGLTVSYAEASLVDQGELQLNFKINPGAPFTGAGAFDAIMEHFGNRVTAVEGLWVRSDSLFMPSANHQTYTALRLLGASKADAARATFTGTMAGRHGFNLVTVVADTVNSVNVLFRKP
jgi:hypothetical protein